MSFKVGSRGDNRSWLASCARWEVLRPEDLSNLGLAVPARPMFPVKLHELHRGIDRFLLRLELKNRESTDEFLGLREGAIDRRQLTAREANGGAFRGRR